MEKKIVRLGGTAIPGRTRLADVFCKIKNKDGNLSISGVEGPFPNGNCAGASGQIDMDVDPKTYISEYAPGWDLQKVKKFFRIWKEWHMNDMRAGCEHQRKLGWTYEEHHDPKTFKGELCPVCGYSIGSAWLTEEIPQSVWNFLESLPDTDKTPAWV